MLTPDPIRISAGTSIRYRLSQHGIPISWMMEIRRPDAPFVFVDVQLDGPYRKNLNKLCSGCHEKPLEDIPRGLFSQGAFLELKRPIVVECYKQIARNGASECLSEEKLEGSAESACDSAVFSANGRVVSPRPPLMLLETRRPHPATRRRRSLG